MSSTVAISLISSAGPLLTVFITGLFQYRNSKKNHTHEFQMKHQSEQCAALSVLCNAYARLQDHRHAENIWELNASIYKLQALCPAAELQDALSALSSSLLRWKCATDETDALLKKVLFTYSQQDKSANR